MLRKNCIVANEMNINSFFQFQANLDLNTTQNPIDSYNDYIVDIFTNL